MSGLNARGDRPHEVRRDRERPASSPTYEAALGLAIVAAEGTRGVLSLLRRHSPEDVWRAGRRDLLEWTEGRSWVDRFLDLRSRTSPREAASAVAASGLVFVPWGHVAYEADLRALDLPPAGLFVKASPEAFEQFVAGARVAVVGTRKASPYGLSVGRAIGKAFAQRGVWVVSGLALGIDGRAHSGCIEAGGRSAAVLGCGADVVYPRRHRELYDRIGSEGVILSELPPGVRPAPWFFPERNRLLAALSHAVVVVEAPQRSGALITAHRALDLGREVFVVPGRISERVSEGTNRLLYDGATMCLDPVSLVEDFLRFTRKETSPFLSGVSDPVSADSGENGLEQAGRLAVMALSAGPRSVDAVAGVAGITSREASAALGLLELRGQVVRVAPGTYGLSGR
ncbi:MAG: DNA-processing protein DprA [Actinobacteria bacterium]|nr:DNA-processing protein DprA [Actinomycetota bacterium]